MAKDDVGTNDYGNMVHDRLSIQFMDCLCSLILSDDIQLTQLKLKKVRN